MLFLSYGMEMLQQCKKDVIYPKLIQGIIRFKAEFKHFGIKENKVLTGSRLTVIKQIIHINIS